MEEVLMDLRHKVSEKCKRPEKFLNPQPKAFEDLKIMAKVLYGCVKVSEERDTGSILHNTLPELIVEDFDEEQIWAGIQMQNKQILGQFADSLGKFATDSDWQKVNILHGLTKKSNNQALQGVDEDLYHDEVLNDEEEDLSDDDEDEGEEEQESENEGEKDSILDDPDFQHMSDSDGDDLPLFDKVHSEESESEDDGEDDEEEIENRNKKRKLDIDTKADEYMQNAMGMLRKGNKVESKKESVEDDFFNLSEMHKFLDLQDASEERRRLRQEKGLNQDSDEEDAIDYFDDIGQGSEDHATYKDYFSSKNPPHDNESMEEGSTELLKESKQKKLFVEEEDEYHDRQELTSTFEETRSKLKRKIKNLEAEAVSDKPWQLQGEISGPARPENSLLQEHLDFDSIAKQAPIITEEVSKSLEDIITRRIKDKAWDDVERKIKPVEDPYEYKKKLVLDSEKSKLSLAEIYEKEYLAQKSALEDSKKVSSVLDNDDPDVPKEIEDIKKRMVTLFAKLDTLAHFHYMPKNLNAEVKIVRNIPSIAMEDVAPIATSEATLLAPQEIVNESKGELIGDSEKSKTDKLRERRKKKSKQKIRAKEKEKRKRNADNLNHPGNKLNKKKVMEDLKKEKGGNLTVIKKKDKSVKSSSAFFSQLQNEVVASIGKNNINKSI